MAEYDFEIIQEIKGKFFERRHFYEKRNAMFEKMEKLYFLEHWDTPRRPSEQRITLSTPQNIIDIASGILAAQNIKISVYNLEDEAQRNLAEQIEKFFMGVLYINSERQETDILYDAFWYMLVKGWVCFRAYWEPLLERRDPEDELPEAWPECPLVLQVIDPANVYPMPSGAPLRKWQWIIYHQRRTILDIEDEFGPLEEYDHVSLKQKAKTELDFIDYWEFRGNEVWNTIIAGKELLRPPTHMPGYTDLPYTINFCKPTGSPKGEWTGLSFLAALENPLREMEKLLSMQARALKVYAALPIMHKGSTPIEVDADIGEVVELGPEDEVGFPTWPGSPPDMAIQLTIFHDEMQEAGFPKAVYGQGPGSVSGYALSQLSEGGRIRLGIPRKQMELCLSVLFRKMCDLCANFSPDTLIPVYGEVKGKPYAIQMLGRDLEGQRIDVSISRVLPLDEARLATIGAQAKQLQVLSDRTIMERYYGVEQPEEELRQKMREMALRHPLMMIPAFIDALQAEGSEWLPLAQEVFQQIIQRQVATMAGGGLPMSMPKAGKGAPPPPKIPSPQGGAPAPKTQMQQALGVVPGKKPQV